MAATRPAISGSAQRERILDAARVLFSTRGFDEVTMTEVADVAGVARATVFNQFGSKHALVEALTENVLSAYQGMLDAALADERHATATLVRALFDQMGAGIQGYLGFYRGMFREIAKLQVGLDEGGAGQRARAEALARITRLFERGRARGELSKAFTATDLAFAYDALANGTITHWLYDDTSEPLRDRMRRAAEIFLGAVAVGPRARATEALPALGAEPEPLSSRGGTHGAKSRSAPRSPRPRARAR